MPKGQPAQPGFLGTPIGAKAATPDTFTLGDVIKEVMGDQGVVSKVVSIKDGQAQYDPNYIMQPGDRVEAVDVHGVKNIAAVGGDGQSLSDWQPQRSPSGRAVGAEDYPQSSDPTFKNASSAAKDHYDKVMSDQNASPLDRNTAYANLVSSADKGDTAAREATTQANTQAKESQTALQNTVKAQQKQQVDYTAAVQRQHDIAVAKAAGRTNVPDLTESERQALIAGPGPLGNPTLTGGQSEAQSQYAFPLANYQGPINPHWAGNANGAVDFAANVGTPVQAVTGGTVAYSDPHYGTAGATVVLNGNDGRLYMYQDLDPNSLPQQGTQVQAGQQIAAVGDSNHQPGVQSTGAHVHVAIANPDQSGSVLAPFETQAGTSKNMDTLTFFKNLAGQPNGTSGNPLTVPGFTPVPGIPGSTLLGNPPAPQKPIIQQVGDKLYTISPDGKTATLLVDGSGLTAPAHFNFNSNGQEYVTSFDPASRAWTTQAVGQPDMTKQPLGAAGNITQLLGQRDQSQAAIQAAYKNGTITYQQMVDYTQYVSDYMDAALQGTTPFERMKFQQEQTTARANTAKDLLDTAVTQTTKTASDLLQQNMTAYSQGKYNTALPADTMYNIFMGGQTVGQQQTQPLTDLANKLLASVGAPQGLAGIGTQALSKGLDPRTDILTGQTAPPPAPTGGVPGTGPNDETLNPNYQGNTTLQPAA